MASDSTDPVFAAEEPWPLPDKSDCVFYHTMSLPDGEVVEGQWDIRGEFAQYIGHVDVKGKTLLDVGTSSGFLAFEAEKAGAIVTGIDASSPSEFDRLQFEHSAHRLDRRAWDEATEVFLKRARCGFWYTHAKLKSQVEMIYMPLRALPFWDRRFDVVLAGAIVEHLSDPVTFVSNLTRIANETVIIAFTPVKKTRKIVMEAAHSWADPDVDYAFWTLSEGLYRRLFDNVGFDLEIHPSTAIFEGTSKQKRFTLVARRR